MLLRTGVPDTETRIMLALISIAFGLIGGAMAFAITYTEYQRHQFTSRRLMGEALRAGIAAFSGLLLLTLISGAVVNWFFC